MATDSMPRARRGLVVLAVILGVRLLGVGESGIAASPTSSADPGPATALATPFGDLPDLTPVTAAAPTTVPATAAPAAFVLPTSPQQWFTPGGGNQGTEGLAKFLAAVALHDNKPLYLSDTWGRTSGSDQSDHHMSRSDSWAVDVAVLGIQAPTPQTERAATRIAAALGVPDWQGGDLTTTIGNYRIQVLWLVAGHYNHVHVGVRRIA